MYKQNATCIQHAPSVSHTESVARGGQTEFPKCRGGKGVYGCVNFTKVWGGQELTYGGQRPPAPSKCWGVCSDATFSLPLASNVGICSLMYSRYRLFFYKIILRTFFNHCSIDNKYELVTSVGGLQCFDVN